MTVSMDDITSSYSPVVCWLYPQINGGSSHRVLGPAHPLHPLHPLGPMFSPKPSGSLAFYACSVFPKGDVFLKRGFMCIYIYIHIHTQLYM